VLVLRPRGSHGPRSDTSAGNRNELSIRSTIRRVGQRLLANTFGGIDLNEPQEPSTPRWPSQGRLSVDSAYPHLRRWTTFPGDDQMWFLYDIAEGASCRRRVDSQNSPAQIDRRWAWDSEVGRFIHWLFLRSQAGMSGPARACHDLGGGPCRRLPCTTRVCQSVTFMHVCRRSGK